MAIKFKIWHFDPELILGIKTFGVPIEESIFFLLTALLVAQSFVLFLPQKYRH